MITLTIESDTNTKTYNRHIDTVFMCCGAQSFFQSILQVFYSDSLNHGELALKTITISWKFAQQNVLECVAGIRLNDCPWKRFATTDSFFRSITFFLGRRHPSFKTCEHNIPGEKDKNEVEIVNLSVHAYGNR